MTEEVWRWNVNPTWNHFCSMTREAHYADSATNTFDRNHHLMACLYFGIGALESFLNYQMREKLKTQGIQEQKIIKILRNAAFGESKNKDSKVLDWPKEICGSDFQLPVKVNSLLIDYNLLRGEITHPKKKDHSLYRDLEEAKPGEFIEAVTDYIVTIYEAKKEPFPYWLLGWNFVGFNHDSTWPFLSGNDQFRHSLRALGIDVPAWEYEAALRWEQEHMTSLKEFNLLFLALVQTGLEIEPKNLQFPTKPRLCKRWWDKELIKES